MMRNLGGSLGIGTLGALFDHQYHLHFTRIAEATSKFSAAVQEGIVTRMTIVGERSPVAGARTAVASIYRSMNKEAFVMSFSDTFLVIALLFYFGALLLFFAQKPQTTGVVAGAH
jgi:DHA2 family multidrug resistance protein